ncbi:MAG: hypothetical protein HOW73_00720 [Polyangiaceae bacterium]|nr:hypothetical protein [Polyangiaceae bacterium]
MTTKANVSGGAIRIECAAGTFDPVLIGSTREETFLEHVRRAIVWCGLPGFEQIPNRPAGFPPKKLWS